MDPKRKSHSADRKFPAVRKRKSGNETVSKKTPTVKTSGVVYRGLGKDPRASEPLKKKKKTAAAAPVLRTAVEKKSRRVGKAKPGTEEVKVRRERGAKAAAAERKILPRPRRREPRSDFDTRVDRLLFEREPKEKKPEVEKIRFKPLLGLVLGMLLLAFLLGLGVYLLLSGSFFTVSDIRFTGLVTVESEELVDAMGVELGDSMFTLDTAAVARKLEKDPRIEVERVVKVYPSTLSVKIRERQPYAAILSEGRYFVVNEELLIMEELTTIPNTAVPVIEGVLPVESKAGAALELDNPTQKNAMQTILALMEQEGIREDISNIDISNLENISFDARDGIHIVVGNMDLIENKIVWISKMLPRLEAEGYLGGTLRVGTGRDFSFVPAAETTPVPVEVTVDEPSSTPDPEDESDIVPEVTPTPTPGADD